MPDIHYEDIVPPFIIKECEESVTVIIKNSYISVLVKILTNYIKNICSSLIVRELHFKIRKLLMEAMLQMKELRYVISQTLREI